MLLCTLCPRVFLMGPQMPVGLGSLTGQVPLGMGALSACCFGAATGGLDKGQRAVTISQAPFGPEAFTSAEQGSYDENQGKCNSRWPALTPTEVPTT